MRIEIEVPDNLEAMNILFVTHDDQGYTLRNRLYDSDMVYELMNEASSMEDQFWQEQERIMEEQEIMNKLESED